MQFGFGAPVSGPLSGPRDLARIAQRRRGDRLRLLHDHRPCRDPARHGGEIPLFRHRRVSRPGRRRPARAADRGRLCRGQDLETAARHFGHRRAAPPAGADRQDHRDDRRAVGGPLHLGHRRRLVQARNSRRSAPSRSTSAAPSPTRRSRCCRELWTNENPSFSGKYAEFSNIFFQPRPVQKRGADLGRRRERPGDAAHRPARRRLVSDRHQPAQPARHAEAPRGRDRAAAPAWPATPAATPTRSARLPLLAVRQGDPGARRQRRAAARLRRQRGDRRPICGPCAISASIAVDFSFGGDTADAVIDNMRRFREDVLAKV